MHVTLPPRKVSDVNVIEGPRYHAERVRLVADPIIRAMAQDPSVVALSDDELGSWDFIVAASSEYRVRGGSNADSIGGPARAIASIVKENR